MKTETKSIFYLDKFIYEYCLDEDCRRDYLKALFGELGEVDFDFKQKVITELVIFIKDLVVERFELNPFDVTWYFESFPEVKDHTAIIVYRVGELTFVIGTIVFRWLELPINKPEEFNEYINEILSEIEKKLNKVNELMKKLESDCDN